MVNIRHHVGQITKGGKNISDVGLVVRIKGSFVTHVAHFCSMKQYICWVRLVFNIAKITI